MPKLVAPRLHPFVLLVPALTLCAPLLACNEAVRVSDASSGAIPDPTGMQMSDSNEDPDESSSTQTTEDSDDESSGDTDPPTSSDASDSSDESDSDNDDEEDAEDEGPGLNFDLGNVPDSPPYDESCGLVDFLFVIDNSGSMGDEQLALINSFPAFINGIEATLDTVDSIHVGVTSSDNYSANVGGCQSIGSLVVRTGGFDSSNSMCGPYADGANYMSEEDELGAAFACAAQIGTDGSPDERPMQAMINGVNGTYGGEDQCNEGFIREDALMVIIIITDEPDIYTNGSSMNWFDDVVAAKDGIPENVVVVSLINTPGGNCFGETAWDIADFTTMFGENGFMADICVPNLATVFDQAIEIIDVACENHLTN